MKRGFTLVELIVVVIIIGILAAVGIPQYRKALERSRGAEAYAALGHIQEAEKVYYATNEVYYATSNPMTNGEETVLDISLPQANWAVSITSAVVAGAPTFTATATRSGGPCGSNTIVIDQTGSITDAWRTCVDTL